VVAPKNGGKAGGNSPIKPQVEIWKNGGGINEQKGADIRDSNQDRNPGKVSKRSRTPQRGEGSFYYHEEGRDREAESAL